MKRLIFIFTMLLSVTGFAQQRELIWPEGSMPDPQKHQIAAMTDEAGTPGFVADDHRTAYLEWFDAPEKPNGGCMILISGGGYYNCCDVSLIKLWKETFTKLGFQCVNFVYRTPRPEGLPIYASAWEDGQRAVRMVRSQAGKRGFDPERIGTISMSAGSHLALLLATSSQTAAYGKVDAIDDIPCHINWAIVNAPAYVTTDGENGDPASRLGIGPDVRISKVFKFDEKTCPVSLHHGGEDPYTPVGSTLVYRELRKMGIPAELHLYPNRGHGAFGLERGVEFLRQLGFIEPLEDEVALMDRFPFDKDVKETFTEDIWPEGEMPYSNENQCHPYLKWYIPKQRKTDAVQIIWSGGAYMGNSPDGFEVDPARKYLLHRGMTVVTVQYRTPRPSAESGLSKHTTAWQDIQRAIRIVRKNARSHDCDPNQIGIMGSSAGGHLTLMGVTSSSQPSYSRIDEIDDVPCNVQWGIGIYPAYVLSDGFDGENSGRGNSDEYYIAPEFNFDSGTAPMLFIHGDADGYSSMGSVRVWEKMRAMGIQSELHTLATRYHCFQRTSSPGTGSYTWLDRIGEFLDERLDNWYGNYIPPTEDAVLARLDEWQDLKFGVIFHWGLYSVPGIVESWPLCSEDFEFEYRDRRARNMDIDEFRKWYWGLNRQFHPTDFNPGNWADIMKDAGMKYMVFTTKHHDGFCMYDTKFTDFKADRNYAKDVFDAFRDKGFMVGAYFSKPDWHHHGFWNPDFAASDRNSNYDHAHYPELWRSYVDFTRNQLKEISTDLGRMDILWLDGGWIDGSEVGLGTVLDEVRQTNPGLICVDRARKNKFENYQTPECTIPPCQMDFPWETCDVLAGWGWTNNPNYKSAGKVIANLIEIVAKGGNLLLGIGPKPDGTIDEGAQKILAEIGKWMRKYGNAIYNTRITENFNDGKVWFTASKDGSLNAIYAFDGEELPTTIEWEGNVPTGKMTLVSNGKIVRYKVSGEKVTVTLPKGMPAESFALNFKTISE